MLIPFTKASACGNDFLIVDGSLVSSSLPDLTKRMCDRHNGVGADGVEWLYSCSEADIEARLINADGSAAEISGNGTRCVAAYFCEQSRKESVIVKTGAGPKTCTLQGRTGNSFEFEIAMGVPEVSSDLEISTVFGAVKGTPVSMGNPHFVVVVPEFWTDWQERAAAMQRNPDFTHGMNIELVTLENERNIHVRFFERGVGETQSSGTGSCAAAMAVIKRGLGKSPLRVHAPGGTQVVRHSDEVFLQGGAQLICRGEFFV
jgi:diaminopimelate epimerase